MNDRPHHTGRVVGPDRQAADTDGCVVGAVGGGNFVVAGANVDEVLAARRGCECQAAVAPASAAVAVASAAVVLASAAHALAARRVAALPRRACR
jgi:hypothetical protein